MIPPHSWLVPGRKPGDVDERQQGDVEGVARAHEACGLRRGVDVEHARELRRLVADDPDREAVQAGEAADDVLGMVLVHLEELAVVDDQLDDVAHVVGLVRVLGHDLVELGVHPLGVVRRLHARRRLQVVLREEADQVPAVLQAGLLILRCEVRNPRLRVVRHRAAELLEADLLAGDGLDHVGTRDEHVRGLLHHEDEVRYRGRVNGSSRARPHDQADLRDHSGAPHVAHEHVAVGARAIRLPPGCAPRPSR